MIRAFGGLDRIAAIVTCFIKITSVIIAERGKDGTCNDRQPRIFQVKQNFFVAGALLLLKDT